MTDNEIKKALECCTNYPACPTDCPLYEQPMDCLLKLSKSTLDLINRLETENDKLRAEVRQWKEEANRWQILWAKAEEDIQTAKAEAVKEFAEKLKELLGVTKLSVIDNLVKEIRRENKDA